MGIDRTFNTSAGRNPLDGLETVYIHDTKDQPLLDKGMELFNKTWPEYEGHGR